jgi:hypothetical protein
MQSQCMLARDGDASMAQLSRARRLARGVGAGVILAALLVVATPAPMHGRGQAKGRPRASAMAPRRVSERQRRWPVPFTPTGDSVLLGFASHTWGLPWVPDEFLARGNKRTVDQGFPSFVTVAQLGGEPDVWTALGNGLRVEDYLGGQGGEFHRDRSGVRLIALESPVFSCDTIILSAVSRHAARLGKRDYRRLHTDLGVRLGDSPRRLRRLVGAPSRRDRFEEYEIHWYLGRPRPVVVPGSSPFREGAAAAYVLRQGKVVEIWLHYWTTEKLG